MSKSKVSSREVYEWPEWKAFAKRLGVDDENVTRISVTLDIYQAAMVEVSRIAVDATKESEEIG